MKSEAPRYQKEVMAEAIAQLREGKIISFGDECGKWLACDACNDEMIAQLLAGKDKHILIDHPGKLSTYVNELPDTVWDLMEMSEKPLIIYLSDTRNLGTTMSGEMTEIGFRMATDKFSIDLCTRFRKPIFLCALHDISSEAYNTQYICATKSKLSKIRIDSHNRFSLINN